MNGVIRNRLSRRGEEEGRIGMIEGWVGSHEREFGDIGTSRVME